MSKNEILPFLNHYGDTGTGVKKFSMLDCFDANTVRISTFCHNRRIKIDVYYGSTMGHLESGMAGRTITVNGVDHRVPMRTLSKLTPAAPAFSFVLEKDVYTFKSLPVKGEGVFVIATVMEDDGVTLHNYVPMTDSAQNSGNTFLHLRMRLSTNTSIIL